MFFNDNGFSANPCKRTNTAYVSVAVSACQCHTQRGNISDISAIVTVCIIYSFYKVKSIAAKAIRIYKIPLASGCNRNDIVTANDPTTIKRNVVHVDLAVSIYVTCTDVKDVSTVKSHIFRRNEGGSRSVSSLVGIPNVTDKPTDIVKSNELRAVGSGYRGLYKIAAAVYGNHVGDGKVSCRAGVHRIERSIVGDNVSIGYLVTAQSICPVSKRILVNHVFCLGRYTVDEYDLITVHKGLAVKQYRRDFALNENAVLDLTTRYYLVVEVDRVGIDRPGCIQRDIAAYTQSKVVILASDHPFTEGIAINRRNCVGSGGCLTCEAILRLKRRSGEICKIGLFFVVFSLICKF